jgi:hypothetical protein
MKTLFFVLMIVANAAIAEPKDTINENVRRSFNKEFSSARIINWNHTGKFVKARFVYRDQILLAYYSTDGKRIALKRNILSNNLPLSLLFSLKKNYSHYWIIDLFEMSFADHTSYFITLENSDRQMVLRSLNNGTWEIYSTKNKEDN